MSRRRGTSVFVRLLAVALVCSVVVAAVPPAAAQSGGPEGSGAAAGADERRCFPAGGHDLTVGDGNPHINVTVHTSLFTAPSPPSALGLEARGVALDSDVIELRTGVLFEGTPEEASTTAVWNSLVILYDYRFSLPMFSGSIDESTYEPTGGPVSGVETRGC
jgi:hypothetical protein